MKIVKEKMGPESPPLQKKISFLEKTLTKKAAMRGKDFEKHKSRSLRLSVFVALFVWLFVGVLIKNLVLSAAISLAAMAVIFVILVQIPASKRRAYSKKVEADLPVFLMKLSTEMKTGKSLARALGDAAKEDGFAAKEFARVSLDMNKGATLNDALAAMNERLLSMNIRRANSNLASIYSHGTKNVTGLKRLAQELLLKQRIESKEFSGKMVVYALVFIAISAIVPAMFMSFVLIGSYFMKLSFTAPQIFMISVGLFPILDGAVLMMINSKTPLFLKQ